MKLIHLYTECLKKVGNLMGEQEKYKKMLKKMIEQTERNKIQSSDQLIQALINEITHSNLLVNKHEY